MLPQEVTRPVRVIDHDQARNSCRSQPPAGCQLAMRPHRVRPVPSDDTRVAHSRAGALPARAGQLEAKAVRSGRLGPGASRDRVLRPVSVGRLGSQTAAGHHVDPTDVRKGRTKGSTSCRPSRSVEQRAPVCLPCRSPRLRRQTFSAAT